MTPSPPQRPSPTGYFIAFEGPEGAGKSTQIAHLTERLARAGIDAVSTREPGGTPSGDRIRSVILDPELDVAPLTEFLLYSASRAQLMSDVIGPALAVGRTVVSDRFAGASLAYQGYGRGLDRAFIAALSDRVTQGVEPDLTLLLDLDVTAGLERVANRGMRDRLERADPAFHQRVRSGFLAIAAERPTWHVLDATPPEATLAESIWRLVASRHPGIVGGSGGGVVARTPDDPPGPDVDSDAPDAEGARPASAPEDRA